MSQIFAPLIPEYTIDIPREPIAIITWLVLLGVLILLIFRIPEKNVKLNRSFLIWMALLSLLVLALTPFFGIPVEIKPGNQFGQSQILHLMLFSAVPWLVAGGILGVLPASLLAGISGLLFSYLQTHDIFTPLIFISMALFFTWGVRQRYRTSIYKLLRIPLFSSLFVIIITSPLLFITQLLTLTGEFSLRIAIALARMPEILLIYGGMLLIGGFICVLIAAIFPKKWGSSTPLVPAPGEVSLINRFLLRTTPIVLVTFFLVSGFMWRQTVNSFRRQILNDLVNTSKIAAEGWHVFVDTGLMVMDNLEDDLQSQGRGYLDFRESFSPIINKDSFFTRITVLSMSGEIVTTHPQTNESELIQVPEEVLSISRKVESGDIRIVWISPESEDISSDLHFLMAIDTESGQAREVIWAYTNLLENPFSSTFEAAFKALENINGFGRIINTSGQVLFTSETNGSGENFSGTIYSTPTYIETFSDDGAYLMQYYFPLEDTEWAVVTAVPSAQIYHDAWQRSWSILSFGLGIFAVLFTLTTAAFKPILKDLRIINADIEKMAKGNFDIKFSGSNSQGEISQLFDRFHQLAGSLASRYQKQADLLSLSEQMSGNNNLRESLNPIMDAAIKSGADSVRILIDSEFGLKQPDMIGKKFSLEKSEDLFAHLDDDIKALVRSQGDVILRDFQITRKLTQKKKQRDPSAIIAYPLKWQGTELGVFWVGYQDKKSISQEDIHYLRTLARKASTTIASARMLDDALGLKNHLESLLDILPDGILLINDTDRVIYNNYAARSLLGLSAEELINNQIQTLMNYQSLTDFIKKADRNVEPRDFTMDDGTIYRVSVSGFNHETNSNVKAVIFQDITQIQKQDFMKSEFVTTTSHELRSPLTLIHGYAKLLRLTGNLNDQQDTYVNNIIEGVEDMKNLVQNLLDIGRLESGSSLEIDRISASELAKNVLEHMQPFAKQRNINLVLLLPESPIDFDADELFLSQALKNLVENAIKFTKMGGDVTMSVREMDELVVFVIQDTGIGIAPLDQRHLFEKFKHRGTPIGQESKGSGLGLAIVKSIAERHGGRVWFESQLAKGSTFYLAIPQRYEKII